MEQKSPPLGVDGPSKMRQRKPQPQALDDHVPEMSSLHVAADASPNKTYGRTPDGTVFTVPQTHDMVSQLLDPRQPRNLSDLVVLVMLVLHGLVAYFLPPALRRPVLASIFIFWRGAYNIGIGWLLRCQSNHRLLVVAARRLRLFESPDSGRNPRPWLYRFLHRELKTKIPDHDYDFATAPVEYNTWLVFRRLVDLILMCDFASYCLFAIACGRAPEDETVALGLGRWALGAALVGFNLWVKLDAHRVVKDYAWYWGDFFFLIDQDLTFDGVFEMAPHPMYSIGYVGYYGISLMAASYQVLFISILAHLAQFAFLVVIENPHIEKTYNPPPPRKRATSLTPNDAAPLQDGAPPYPAETSRPWSASKPPKPSSVHNLIGISNLDLFRVTDYSVILLVSYLAVLVASTPRTPLVQGLFVAHAVAWRLWNYVGLGIILNQQSLHKLWTRHFVKYGESTNEAWRQWKAMCHLSMAMCHASAMAASWKMYAAPDDWRSGWGPLKHVGGAGLIALQLWTAASVYQSLGEFGWFFGDFFFEHEAKLTYTSIYRFLNNPERLFGSAGVWGAALITWSRSIFLLAVLSHGLQLGFLEWVEKPHMQRVFGRKLRGDAGLTKFIKRSLPPPVKGWQESMDKVLDETTRFVLDFVESARPRFASGVKTVVRDTSALFNLAPARLTLSRLPSDSTSLSAAAAAAAAAVEDDSRQYTVEVKGDPLLLPAVDERATGKESMGMTATARFALNANANQSHPPPTPLEYGAPLRVTWTAPADHDRADWIGLYMVTDNPSRETSEASSLGHWAPTTAGTYDVVTADSCIVLEEQPLPRRGEAAAAAADSGLVRGEVLFSGDKLCWSQGVFEVRYHHGNSHTVMAISQPFEVRVSKFESEDVVDLASVYADADANGVGETYQRAIEHVLLPVVRNCLDRNPDIAPATADEPFGSHVERDGKYARRVVYVIHQMFGIEFAPAVVLADGNVRNLAWRICNAKQVLAPYSMSTSRGAATPIG